MASSPITGRCLCGNVTFTAEGDAVVQAACHCTDCQRQTGNPFSVIVAVAREGFSAEGDTLATYATIGEDHGGETQRNFCSACGSPVFSVAAVMPEMIFIKAGALDDASWYSRRSRSGPAPRSRGRRTSRAQRSSSAARARTDSGGWSSGGYDTRGTYA